MSAQAGLDRIHQQQAAVGLGQFACGAIELDGHGAAGIAFTHDRFEEHGLDEPAIALGIGKCLAQLFDIVRGNRQYAVFVAVAGQVLLIGLATGIGVQGGAVGAAVECALDRQALDFAPGVACSRLRHQLGIDVGDARGQRNGFGAGIQAQEAGVGRTTTGLPDFALERLSQAQLREAGRHHVGHDLGAGKCFENRLWGMTKTEHAVTA